MNLAQLMQVLSSFCSKISHMPPAYRTKKLLPCRQQLDSGHMHSPYTPIRRHFTAVRRYICRPGRP